MKLILAALASGVATSVQKVSVTSLQEAQEAVARVEAAVTASAEALVDASNALHTSACSPGTLNDPLVTQLVEWTKELDADVETSTRAVAAYEPTANRLELLIGEKDSAFQGTVAQLESMNADTESGLEDAATTIQVVGAVLEQLEAAMGNMRAAGEVVGVFTGLRMAAEDTQAKLTAESETKTAEFTHLLNSTRTEQRQLQQMFTEAHAKAVTARHTLAAAKAGQKTFHDIMFQELKQQGFRREACNEALGAQWATKDTWDQAALPGFNVQRRVDNLINQADLTYRVLHGEADFEPGWDGDDANGDGGAWSFAQLASSPTRRPAPRVELQLADSPPLSGSLSPAARVEAAVTLVRVAAQKEKSPQLQRLAQALKAHTAEEDLRMLTALASARSNTTNTSVCETERFAAVVAQVTARDQVMALEERKGELVGTVAMTSRVLAALEKGMDPVRRTVLLGHIAEVKAIEAQWEATSQTAVDAVANLSAVLEFVDAYSVSNGTTQAASLPGLIGTMQENVAWLRDETAARQGRIDKAVSSWSFEDALLHGQREWYAGAVSSMGSDNATSLETVEQDLATAQGDLTSARDRTDAASACHQHALHSVESTVVRLAEAVVAPVTSVARRLRGL